MKIIGLLLLLPVLAFGAEMPQDDTVKGAKDHPFLSRFTDAKLTGYMMKDFDGVELVTGKQIVNKQNKNVFEKKQAVEGRYTRIIYVYPKERSALEVMRNYRAAIQKAGLSEIFSCEKTTCGQVFGELMNDYIQSDHFRGEGSTDYWASPFNYGRGEPRYMLASGKRTNGALLYAAVYVVPPIDGQLGGIYVQIVESEAMETGKVTANLNADEMSKGISAEGKIALYGLYFDTDKSVVKAESKPQLAEIALLLQKYPALKVYVVGHTDNQGTLSRNLSLSQQRAEAVVHALVTDYKIDVARLAAKGVASFSPVASNDAEAGRAKNRRVELVKQ